MLGEHALRLTPPGDARAPRAAAPARRPTSSAPASASELTDAARARGRHPARPAAPRVRAWLMLAVGAGIDDVRRPSSGTSTRALLECGDDRALRARVLASRRCSPRPRASRGSRRPRRGRRRRSPPRRPRRSPSVERAPRARLGARLRGLPIDDVCARFAASRARPRPSSTRRDGQGPAPRVARRGRRGAGHLRPRMTRSPTSAARPSPTRWLRLHQCELELRAGAWDAREHRLDEWAQSDEEPCWSGRCTSAAARCWPPGRGDAAGGGALGASRARAGGDRERLAWPRLEAPARSASRRCSTATRRGRPSTCGAVWDALARERRRRARARSRSRPTSSRRSSARRRGARREPSPRGCAARRARTSTRGRGPPRARCAAARSRRSEAAATLARGRLRARSGSPSTAARALLAPGPRARGGAASGARRASSSRRRPPASTRSARTAGRSRRAPSSPASARAGRAPRGELTPTERRVAELAAAGRRTRRSRQALVVTAHTVEAHLRRVYAKLGVRSRAQLAARFAGSAGTSAQPLFRTVGRRPG